LYVHEFGLPEVESLDNEDKVAENPSSQMFFEQWLKVTFFTPESAIYRIFTQKPGLE
jgi:hypothetical protein